MDNMDKSTVFLHETQHSGGQTRSVLVPIPRVLTLYFPFYCIYVFLTGQLIKASISIHTGLDVCIEAGLRRTDLQ